MWADNRVHEIVLGRGGGDERTDALWKKKKIFVKPLWLDKMTLSRGLREANAEPGARGQTERIMGEVEWGRQPMKRAEERERRGAKQIKRVSERKRRQKTRRSAVWSVQAITALHYVWEETNLPFASVRKTRQGRERRFTKCHLWSVFV